MPAAHDLPDPVVPPSAAGQPGTYRGRRRREPEIEVTRPVILPPLEPAAARVPLPLVPSQREPQYATRAEARAAHRAAVASQPPARVGTRRPRSALGTTAAAPRPVGDNVRRAPQRRAATPPQPRHRRGLALVVTAGAVAALGGVAAIAGALPTQSAAQASAALGPRAAQAVGAVQTQGRSVTSEQASASVLGDNTDRAFRMVAVSRSQERGPIAGCSGKAPVQRYANGQLPASVLCELPFAAPHRLRDDAAARLIRLSEMYKGQFGVNLCLTDSYRSLASQYSVAARKPGLAARPGTSEHGWGLAIDVCGGPDTPGSARRAWFSKNAPAFGWVSPAWARSGGPRPEPWHWEFAEGQ